MSIIASNAAANTAIRNLAVNTADQQKYLAQLSSGSRINNARDDAGGLGVATRLQSDVTSLAVAQRNASQGQAVAQTIDGALSRIADILQRQRALAVQAQNGALDAASRGFLNAEYGELDTQVTSIIANTQFNGQQLLGGYSEDFLVSQVAGDTITLAITTPPAAAGGGVAGADGTNAAAAVTLIDAQITATSTARAEVGGIQARFDFQGQIAATSFENLEAARSIVQDADIAQAQTQFTNAETLTEAAIAALSAANEIPSELLRLLQ